MSSTTYLAFYRNMNLGHRGSPDRTQLESAIESAGGVDARSFQTNGTISFRAEPEHAAEIVRDAAPRLLKESGYDGVAFVRALSSIVDVLARKPFEGHGDERTYRETITFFDGGKRLRLDLPWTCPKGDVDIIELHDSYALSIIRKTGSVAGSPTAELESRLGTLATTRTIGTLERLARALS